MPTVWHRETRNKGRGSPPKPSKCNTVFVHGPSNPEVGVGRGERKYYCLLCKDEQIGSVGQGGLSSILLEHVEELGLYA